MKKKKQKLLLHTCCAPCGAFVFDCLEDFNVTCYYYNPNIWPEKEYIKRRNESKKYCDKKNISFIEESYNPETWNKTIRDLESEPESGKRCKRCFELRLTETAEYAKENNFDYFATTLTISAHKNSETINKVGNEVADKVRISFYKADWKKNDGYKKSCEISRDEGFYRQNYCGCKYSIRR